LPVSSEPIRIARNPRAINRGKFEQHGQVHAAQHLGGPCPVEHRHGHVKRRRPIDIHHDEHAGAVIDLIASLRDPLGNGRAVVGR
jgi:hypothetical protein